ncbi:hypothetical protein [Psychrobacter sp.]|uniref:hypothetical protein n=1 Tax=Psychrobacter sp. TaxID=56811 RepID=UPI0025DFBE93|nr:hypothetical protein [Psychrobacter sp.]
MQDPNNSLDSNDNLEGIDAEQGLTPMHRQNIDESRIDEVLVDDAIAGSDYPDIRDIADNDAVSHSFDDE